jgi:cell division protein FtsB
MREWRVGGGPPVPPSLVLALLVPACVFILLATAQRALEGYQMTRQVEAARKEVTELRQQNVELQERIARHRSDAYIERVAREELNLVRPGDVPVIVIAPTPEPTPARPARVTPTPAASIPRQWLRHFFDEP